MSLSWETRKSLWINNNCFVKFKFQNDSIPIMFPVILLLYYKTESMRPENLFQTNSLQIFFNKLGQILRTLEALIFRVMLTYDFPRTSTVEPQTFFIYAKHRSACLSWTIFHCAPAQKCYLTVWQIKFTEWRSALSKGKIDILLWNNY